MNRDILKHEIQEFINAHVNADISRLALQKNQFPELSWPFVLSQIGSKSKCREKLPTWFRTSNILYPEKISIEQSSSEKTARYKAELVSGNFLIDLTGGFGVDCHYFSKTVKNVVHCEINPELSEISKFNSTSLHTDNIEFICGDGVEILANRQQKFDWIYIDPSRRNAAKGKVFMLCDCLPNVPDKMPTYFEYSDQILIKTAPILDISAGLGELKFVKSIHIVAVDNEVKELLWEISKQHSGSIRVKTVNILKESVQEFQFILGQNPKAAELALPKRYLYEPNPAMMKSGGFDEIGTHFGLGKLHRHSHLYTSDNIVDFPGRVFEIKNSIAYSKDEMKLFEHSKANIATRNFPHSVEMLRTKWKIADGGDQYCFFTTALNDKKIVLICAKIHNT